MRTGAPWHDLPERYPPYQTCHRRFQQWARAGVVQQVLKALAEDLRTRGGLDLSECFIDGTFIAAKKGADVLEQPSGAKAAKLLAVADRFGLPIAVCAASASPHEIKLVNAALEAKFVKAKPKRLIGDKAYDSDPLDKELRAKGIELIAPHKSNRVKPPTQDGRMLRRYKRRWKVERLFSWMQNFRRLVVCYEYYVENLLCFIHLGCILILLRRYL